MATPVSGGIQPLTVASMTPWQQQGLSGLASGYAAPQAMGFMKAAQGAVQNMQAQSPDARPMFQQGNQFYDQAGNLVTQGTTGLTDSGFAAGVARYFNPFGAKVHDQTMGTITQAGDEMRARLAAKGAGSRSFGDSSSAVQNALLSRDILKQKADTSANLNYAGYKDAVDNTLNQFNAEAGRSLTGAQVAGGMGANRTNEGFGALRNFSDLATLAYAGNKANLGNNQYLNDLKRQGATDTLKAGTVVQDQNQRMLDAVTGEFNRKEGFTDQQLAAFASYIMPFLGGSAGTGEVAGEGNFARRGADVLTSLAGAGIFG